MTTANTMDTQKTVEEIIRIKDAGAQLVRVTAPNLKAAENLYNIKNLLHQKNRSIPLVADIHFTPKAAEIAASLVEKVRINPGNYIDRKHFNLKEYSKDEYQAEIKRIEEKIASTSFGVQTTPHRSANRNQSWFSIRSDCQSIWRYSAWNGGVSL